MLLKVKAVIDGQEHYFETGLFGSYNIDNVRAAMAAGLLFGVPEDEIIMPFHPTGPTTGRR